MYHYTENEWQVKSTCLATAYDKMSLARENIVPALVFTCHCELATVKLSASTEKVYAIGKIIHSAI